MNYVLFWVILGVVLCLMELFLPTAFVEFALGLSAFVVALVALVLPWFNLADCPVGRIVSHVYFFAEAVCTQKHPLHPARFHRRPHLDGHSARADRKGAVRGQFLAGPVAMTKP